MSNIADKLGQILTPNNVTVTRTKTVTKNQSKQQDVDKITVVDDDVFEKGGRKTSKTPAMAPVLPKSSLLDPSQLPPAALKSPKSPGPKSNKKGKKKEQAKPQARAKSPWQQIEERKAKNKSKSKNGGGSSTSKQ